MREETKELVSVRMLVLWGCHWQLPLLLCFTGLLQCDVCYSQRLVQIQEGPLYRVKGYPISISCNVSGFKGPLQQDFEFTLKKAVVVNVISTKDSYFAYAHFSNRIRDKDVEIERLSGSSVLLKINTLLESDAGVFLCHTPNTDGAYFGTYGAETTVNVIEDTLIASYLGSATLSMSEGDSLQLECEVSTQTFQHTHLSVTWFLHGKEDVSPRPIITLDRDLTVKPGAGYEESYRSGLLSMEKVGETTFRLKMLQVQQSDSGKLYCKAIEWIQDPDRLWTQIAHKTTTPANVEIKRIEVAPDSFITDIEASKGPLQEGDVLEIRCSVKAQKLLDRFYSVTWIKDKNKVAQIGPSGVLTVFDDYKKREAEAELRVVKTSHMDYLLTIRSARADDQGQYQCEVKQENMNKDGTFTKIQTQLSRQMTVSINAKENVLAVVMVVKSDAVTEGEFLQVICSVSGFQGPLSVLWQHKKDPGDSYSDIISLNYDGVMSEPGIKYQSRDIQTFRSPDGNFTLEIGAAKTSDSGEYKCIVSEWIIESNGKMKKGNIQSQQKAISVNSIVLSVSLKSRAVDVTIGSTIELLCIVKGPKVPLAVQWKFWPSNSSTWLNILSIHHNGEIAWGAEQRNYQPSIRIVQESTSFSLRVMNYTKQQEGKYMCQVDAYQKDLQKASKNSNPLAVTVKKPVSKLTLSRPRSPLQSTVNTDVKLECSITESTTSTSNFKITWLVGSEMLLTMDLDAVVKLGPAAGLEMDQRIRLEKKQKQTFLLTIHQVRTSDSGQYHCEVEEWLQDPLGDWYSLQKKSVSIRLVVEDKGNDFKMNKVNTPVNVKEGEQIMLNCSVDGVGTDSTLRYSLTWFQNQSSNVPLLTYSYDGRLKYNKDDSELEGRFYFSSSNIGVFHLTIPRSIKEDSGGYSCQVQQYHLDCKGHWSLKASDISGVTDVSVHPIESKLDVQKENRSLNIKNPKAGFTIDCVITTRSSDVSVFEVTWSRGRINERPIIIFTASRDGTLHSPINDKDLMFGHPSANSYKLTVSNINPTDIGVYHCQVVEWIRTTTNNWRKIGEDRSGELSVHVETENKQKDNNFTMDGRDKHLEIKEGDQFELSCSLNLEIEDPTLHYNLRWVFDSLKSTSGIILLTYSYDGRLQYHTENQQHNRLRFSKPTPSTFNLVVLNSDTADGGSYQCMVDQYKLDCEGKWKLMTSVKSGSTIVNVRSIESKLRVQKQNQWLNITSLQAELTINCEIESWSSNKSAFEVTWFKGHEQNQPIIIFIAKRDGTLHNLISDKDLVFGRPRTTHYTLKIPAISHSDLGQYYCQVDEWLPTMANIWKKVASDKSGELSVHVHIEGETVKQTDPLGLALGVTIPLICFLALVIIILLRKEFKRKSDLKKKEDSLWAENNPLKPAGGDVSS
ncbi:immunoglobulin superfamily member 2 [Paramisgurnus dabryanus]|uniref:immunoglobulin superfamily member 2 n=1 Tax=Paramisgurnus dabryanus TaxID=90735 RepID=UPI0031F436D0